MRTNLGLCLLFTGALVLPGIIPSVATAETEGSKVLRVEPDGKDPSGVSTGEPIHQALNELGESEGTIIIEPGAYVIRNPLRPHSHTTLRGADVSQTELRLPKPARARDEAAEGEKTVTVTRPESFRAGTSVEILPPKVDTTFGKEGPEVIEADVVAVDGPRLELAEPLPAAVPEGSRIGYANHILALGKRPTTNVTIESLTFDGGRVREIPMPGHAKRCAIWAASPYTYEGGRQAPPLRELTVRHCEMRDLYGRGVAFYNVADSEVIGCRIRRVDDEAIDFDHFNENCRAFGNFVEEARAGLVLNDTYHCTVRYNRFVDCGVGIRLWWWHKVSPDGVNRHNVIEHNEIQGVNGAAIALSRNAFKNTVRYNFVDGPIRVVEEDNRVSRNTHWEK